MKSRLSFVHYSLIVKKFSLGCLAALMFVSLVGCRSSNEADKNLQDTQMALSVQQTILAKQQTESGASATIAAQQATIQAQAAQPPQAPQATSNTPATPVSPLPQPPLPQPPVVTEAAPQPPAPPSGNLNQMMQTASILVYEDVYSDPALTPYVQKTLKAMGLNQFKYDGNAQGWLKNDLLAGPGGGKPWDLVILAIEERDDVSGEYYEYVNTVLQQGSSVIIEAWNIDAISQGTISPILIKCGVTVYPYFAETGTNNDAVLWPLGAQSPLLSDPNSGMSFTYALDTWVDSFDLGSKMAMTGQGDAQLLLGTNAQEKMQDGTLASCMGGQLTLQTFSSHSFPYETMGPLWENYITNALKVRFQGRGQ